MIKKILKGTILNWKKPIYSSNLYEVCKRYVDLYNGDNNWRREENGEFRLLKELHAKGKLNVVVDVGANVGSYTQDVLNLNPKAKVYCFEPDPRAFAELSKSHTGKANIFLNNIGLGDSIGTLKLNMASHASHSSFVDFGEGIETKEVKVDTLDNQKLPNIDLLKIDVEGFEFNVLKGAKETLKRINAVQFEFSGANFFTRTYLKDFMDYLEPYGFVMYKVKADRIEKVKWNPEEEKMSLKNYVAMKEIRN